MNLKFRLACRFLALLALLSSFCVCGQDLEKDFKQEIALYRIRPNQLRSQRRDSDGTPVSEAVLRKAVRDFYDWLYPLDQKFLKQFKIKEVIFKDTVYDRDGDAYQWLVSGDDLLLDADMSDKMFYMNMFLLYSAVMPRTHITHWTKLIPNGFTYENDRGSMGPGAQKKLDAILAEWDKYFVSRLAMYSPEVDMAETFSYMIMKGPGASAFARKNSPLLLKKFDLVNEVLVSMKGADSDYMDTLLAEDLSKLKKYSPSALAVRLFRVYSGVWLQDGDDADSANAPVRIGDPVEVAGRKINPLILSLEVKDKRLFQCLMDYNVNPNVSNSKKVSALMLAIANNDPDQVKTLLDAGAKVTQDAFRAGTASGVNAGIVKMFQQYQAQVKSQQKQEKPEKSEKKTNVPPEELERITGGSVREGDMPFLRDVSCPDGFELPGNIDLRTAIQYLQPMGQVLEPDFRIVLSQADKIATKPVTLVCESCTLYDMLRILCANHDFEMGVDPAKKRVIIGPHGDAAVRKYAIKTDPSSTVLYRRLNSIKLGPVDFEKVPLEAAANYITMATRDNDPDRKGVRIVIPQGKKYATMAITLKYSSVSPYDLLQFICKKTGLTMSLEELNNTVYLEDMETGKTNSSTKRKQ